MDILSKIMAKKIESLNQLKRLYSVKDLEKSKFFERNNKSIVNSLKENETSIIAEHKRKSPSKSEKVQHPVCYCYSCWSKVVTVQNSVPHHESLN